MAQIHWRNLCLIARQLVLAADQLCLEEFVQQCLHIVSGLFLVDVELLCELRGDL
jgi:hypothetical protein